jgi:2'-5' RNA ligase
VRAFIAVDLNEEIRGKIAEIQSALGRFSSSVRWVRPSSIHITLRFLGEISPDQQKRLTEMLADRKCGVPPFTIAVERMGFFPHARSPRVTWLGVEEGKNSLQQLARYVEVVATDVGFLREERPFSPHITFGRIKYLPDLKRFLEATAPFSEIHCGTVQIRQFHLYESQLHRDGPIYTRRASFELE